MAYIDKRHDPERIVDIGVLFPSLRVRALTHVVVCEWAASQHVSEIMYELTVRRRDIPTAALWEERICNQWAHQGSEPYEKMKSLQKSSKVNKWLLTWKIVNFPGLTCSLKKNL